MLPTVCFHKMVVFLSVLIFISMMVNIGGTTTTNGAIPARCTRNCVSSKPICGSDGKTYPSECHLKKRACVVKDLVKNCNGPCKKVKGHSCCSIKRKCPKRFRASGPVCGSNIVTYPNMCILAIAICKEKGLKIQGESKCSDLVATTRPPAPSPTTEGEFCIDEQLGKQCSGECKTVNDVHCCDIRTRCPQVFKDSGHVCGTDGVSYINQCVLAKKTCKTAGLLLEKDYDGKCREKQVTTFASELLTTTTPEEKTVTGSQNCHNVKLGKNCIAECKFVHGIDCCNILQACPISFKESGPVCGNNNITYSNLCTLSREACRMFDSQLRHSHMGVCKVRGEDTETSPYILETKHRTAPPTRTHRLYSTLEAYTTATKVIPTSSVLLRTGNGKTSVQYTSKSPTNVNDYRTEKAITTQIHSQNSRTTELSSSSNLSSLKNADTDVYCNDTTSGKHCRGECKSVNWVHCCDIRKRCPDEFKGNRPICGTDFITYRNHCVLAKKACRTLGSTLQKLNDGVCKEETTMIVTESVTHSTNSPEITELQPDRLRTTSSETTSIWSAIITEIIPSTPAIKQTNMSSTQATDSIEQTTMLSIQPTEIISNTTITIDNKINNISHCEDKVLGKDCMAECKFVSGVHCCDIVDSGCPRSFTLSGHVCGSDGFSYSNLCVLVRRSCKTSGSSLVKISYGKCDETSPVIKDEDANANVKIVCVDEKRGKSCDGECKVVNGQHCCDIRNRCPNKLKKTGSVCGNDGRVYGNQCALARKSCREHGSSLQMANKGPCKTTSDRRISTIIRPKTIPRADDRGGGNSLPGEGDMTMPPFIITDLLIQRDRVEEDPCRGDCPSWDSPVCGSNMVTYKNACELKKVQCKRPSIRQLCDARCRMNDGRNCCMMMKKCHKSLRNTGTVCGTDGKSYANECDLFREACRSVDYNLQKLNYGPCPLDQPQTTKMKFSMIECLSTFHCPIEMALAGEVCSDIGTTYQDECALKFDSCWGENKNIGLDYVGRCKP